MSTPVVPISSELVRGAARSVAESFFDNEIWVWLLRRDWQRRRLLPRHYRAMIRRVYMPRGGAWTTPDTLGAALWFPPGTLEMSRRERLAELASLMPEGASSLARGSRWEELTSPSIIRASRTGTSRPSRSPPARSGGEPEQP